MNLPKRLYIRSLLRLFFDLEHPQWLFPRPPEMLILLIPKTGRKTMAACPRSLLPVSRGLAE